MHITTGGKDHICCELDCENRTYNFTIISLAVPNQTIFFSYIYVCDEHRSIIENIDVPSTIFLK